MQRAVCQEEQRPQRPPTHLSVRLASTAWSNTPVIFLMATCAAVGRGREEGLCGGGGVQSCRTEGGLHALSLTGALTALAAFRHA